MDSQNNAKGGYGYGGSANNQAQPVTYMAGSKLSATWTSQHSCGSENSECQIVIQYMCNDGASAPPGVLAATDPAAAAAVGGQRAAHTHKHSRTPPSHRACLVHMGA